MNIPVKREIVKIMNLFSDVKLSQKNRKMLYRLQTEDFWKDLANVVMAINLSNPVEKRINHCRCEVMVNATRRELSVVRSVKLDGDVYKAHVTMKGNFIGNGGTISVRITKKHDGDSYIKLFAHIMMIYHLETTFVCACAFKPGSDGLDDRQSIAELLKKELVQIRKFPKTREQIEVHAMMDKARRLFDINDIDTLSLKEITTKY